MKWNEDNINKKNKCKLTNDYFFCYKKAFFNWYKQQDSESLNKWGDYLYEKRMSTFDKRELELFGDVAREGERMKVDSFLKNIRINCDDYKSYLQKCERFHVKQALRVVETNLLWPGLGDYSEEEKALLSPLAKKFGRLNDASRNLHHSRHHPDILKILPQENFAAAVKDLNSHVNSEKELKLLGRLYDDYDNFKIPSSYHHNKVEDFKKRRNAIQDLFRSRLKAGLPHLDVYRKSTRLPGAGWSNQK
tara:strand:+ start:42 stop:785 length:744 start_codon:yes stop_codon:yes gene_type:complete